MILWQNLTLRAFAVRSPLVRELELSTQPEHLPWFTWLWVTPFVCLALAALYLHVNWDSIPDHFPVHWTLDGRPDRWANRSVRGVYAPLILGAEIAIWLLGFALVTWYGSRRSEPLRKPVTWWRRRSSSSRVDRPLSRHDHCRRLPRRRLLWTRRETTPSI